MLRHLCAIKPARVHGLVLFQPNRNTVFTERFPTTINPFHDLIAEIATISRMGNKQINWVDLQKWVGRRWETVYVKVLQP